MCIVHHVFMECQEGAEVPEASFTWIPNPLTKTKHISIVSHVARGSRNELGRYLDLSLGMFQDTRTEVYGDSWTAGVSYVTLRCDRCFGVTEAGQCLLN